MRYRIVILILLTLIHLLPEAGTADTLKTNVSENISGRIEMGLLGISTDTKLTGIDSRGFLGLNSDFSRISDLGNSRSMHSFGTAFLLFDLNYALNDDTTLYIGTPFFDDDREGLTVGCELLFNDNSTLNASLFFGEMTQWKDPYLTGTQRDITYSDFHGLTLNFSGVLGSDMILSYTYRKDSINNDISGDNFPILRRSGTTHTFKSGYNFYLSEGLDTTLTPSIKYMINNSDGDANSYQGFGSELNFAVNKGNNAFSMAAIVETMGFSGINPYFEKKRSQMEYTLQCFYTRKNIFGKNWYSRMGFAYNRIDSNIPFFNENNILYGISLGYSFN